MSSVSRIFGVLGKFLRIDLTRRKSELTDIPLSWFMNYLGGRGLCAKFYADEIGSDVHPFSPENKLIFFTGPLTSTFVPSSSKCGCSTKSPLTGRYLCTSAAGSFGPELKRSGYDGMIISGRSRELTYLEILDGDVEFRSATHLRGSSTSEAQEAMRRDIKEPRAGTLSIGPAGERLVRFASIRSDHRCFGRGGAGAVMGSKNLKGVVVKGDRPVEVAEPGKLRNRLREMLPEFSKATDHYRRFGTIYIIDVLSEQGLMPVLDDESFVYGYQWENRHMVESFLRGEMPRENWHDGLFVVRLMMAAYMAAETGKKLRFPPPGLEEYIPKVQQGTYNPRLILEGL